MNEYQNFASFQIESLDGKYVCNVEDAMIDNLPVVAANIPPARRNTSAFSHLDGLVFDDVEGKSEVEAVIGIGHADAFVVEDVRQGSLRADASEASGKVAGGRTQKSLRPGKRSLVGLSSVSPEKRRIKISIR